MNIKQIIQLMAERNVAKASDLVGVSLPVIHNLESALKLRFPVTYIHFLHTCGRSAGKLAGWAALYFDDLTEIIEEFELHSSLMNSATPMPPNAMLIGQHDCHFDYFLCDGNDDPDIYRITFDAEGTHCQRFASSFTSYLEHLTLHASNNTKAFEPFYIDECGEMHNEDLSLAIPLSD